LSEDEVTEKDEVGELLLPQDTLLSAGIHIGSRMKTRDMEPFIYRVRPDGLYVLDMKKTTERIKIAAKFLSRFDPSKIAVAATRLYAQEPVQKFCALTKTVPIVGRFIPGLLSNPLYPDRMDPEVMMVSEQKADGQAIKEASSMGIPVIALCSTDNDCSGIDLVIPTNNKGRKALAIVYWLLAREMLREKGDLSSNENPPESIEDFEAKIIREDNEQ
jgi:small subunit ribosomal protein S2